MRFSVSVRTTPPLRFQQLPDAFPPGSSSLVRSPCRAPPRASRQMEEAAGTQAKVGLPGLWLGRALVCSLAPLGFVIVAACGTSGQSDCVFAACERRTSLYGFWQSRDALPAFVYQADQDALPEAEWDPLAGPPTRRNWVMLGNRSVQLQAANDGTVALFDESHGLRWWTAPDPTGTGISIIEEADGTRWGSASTMRGGSLPSDRTFGPTWFEIRDERAGLTIRRTILCPEGEVPWVLVRVRLELAAGAEGVRSVGHVEQWALRPRLWMAPVDL